MEILHADARIVICIKPAGIVSTDEPGGMSSLLREHFSLPTGCFRTVHRLDAAVSGLMVYARSQMASSILSAQIRERVFEKEYLAVIHGAPEQSKGTMRDLLLHDRAARKTSVVQDPCKDAKEAELSYEVLQTAGALSLVRIRLHTGRTHQIRVQFASRNLPLVGDRKYGTLEDDCPIALWSYRLKFRHPQTEQMVEFSAPPAQNYPWTEFSLP